MDTDLTDRHWKIAAKIVLHEMRQRLIAAEAIAALNQADNYNYPMSHQEVVDQAEIEMYQNAVNALLAILL